MRANVTSSGNQRAVRTCGGAAVVTEDSIREAQRVLETVGYDPGHVDGEMDGQTRQALRNFQDYNKIPQTGRLDVVTAQRLADRGAHFSGLLGADLERRKMYEGPAYVP